MKLLKYFAGSLILSFGVLMVLAIVIRAIGVNLPSEFARYLPIVWFLLAVLIFPLAKKVVRV